MQRTKAWEAAMLDLLVLGRAEFITPPARRRRVPGAAHNDFERVAARALVAMLRRLLANARG
jgi:hypothetical protein